MFTKSDLRGVNTQRLIAPGAAGLELMERTTRLSFSFKSPLRTAVISVKAWSVIPRETSTGSMELSGCHFQTTAVVARGVRVIFDSGVPAGSAACDEASRCFSSIPYCAYRRMISSGDMGGL